jgi:hypothetical protein
MGRNGAIKGSDEARIFGVGRKIFSVIAGSQARQKLYRSGSKITPQAPPGKTKRAGF